MATQKEKNEPAGRQQGHLHPMTQIINDIVRIFHDLGFTVADGPEIESEYYNFDKLNVPKDHPARDLWDTFWLQSNQKISNLKSQIQNKSKNQNTKSQNLLLRTHTSPVQIRHMEDAEPPIAIIAPGKTFRYEATDATHEAQFFQVEGLMIGENITLGHLRGVLEVFFQKLFQTDMNIRFRPSYFPFVEPGVEIDVSCFACSGKGCSVCKHSGWIEVMGAGMVHPTVLSGVGIDPRKWQGFAFGGGIDRLMMLQRNVPDIRLSYTGDLRFVQQF